MTPKTHHKVFETPTSVYWHDDDGILCATSKKNAPTLSLEERKRILDEFILNIGKTPICLVLDVTDMGAVNRETQTFNYHNLPKIFKAIAFVSRSPLGKMLGRVLLGLRQNPFPTRIFSNYEDAKEWIKEYL
jgi:hypothetical protein